MSLFPKKVHPFNDEICDDEDMYRQHCKLYAQANMLVRNLYVCPDQVKITLFRANYFFVCCSFVG